MDWILQLIPFLRSRKAKPELDLAAMAAAPAEVPTPLATHVLPPAKRKKRDPSCPATANAGWSSLPDDLVCRIADSFLASNDLDHYMYFRAVCPSWRAATADPRDNPSDPLFHPRRWIVLDEGFQGDDDELLLLNVSTGRFLRKKVPLLRDYFVVATTSGGFIVLADRNPPHAARVFSPLTGVLTRFAAPVPPEARVAIVSSTRDASLTIHLLGDSSRKIYTAALDSEGFDGEDYQQGVYNFLRNAVVGGAYQNLNELAWGGALADLHSLLGSIHGDPAKFFFANLAEGANDVRCFLAGFGQHMLLVMRGYGGSFVPPVWKMNAEIGRLVSMRSLGRYSIFVGHRRCLYVDVDKFPGIEANCVYYTEHLGSSAHICKCNIKDYKVERISEAAEFVKQDKQFVLAADRPFMVIQLLCSYTINIPDSQLALPTVVVRRRRTLFQFLGIVISMTDNAMLLLSNCSCFLS